MYLSRPSTPHQYFTHQLNQVPRKISITGIDTKSSKSIAAGCPFHPHQENITTCTLGLVRQTRAGRTTAAYRPTVCPFHTTAVTSTVAVLLVKIIRQLKLGLGGEARNSQDAQSSQHSIWTMPAR